MPGLKGRISQTYPPYDLRIPDERRADAWTKEFGELVSSGSVPALSIIRLGGDHTSGTSPGTRTPRAMVADNDVALGRIVEGISQSSVWNESAIFIVEDDAQNGPDHIDAHRSPVLVVSPFSKRRTVDSTLYTTCSVLRTIELVLGLPPMSQYDASASPMYGAFQATPVTTPFTHLAPRIRVDEMNGPDAWGADASRRMDLEEADRAPEQELNEIIWRSVKGAGSPMPPIVHRAWVRPSAAIKADDDDR